MKTDKFCSVVIAGLGNPGQKYQYTRHNIGFLAVDHLAHSLKLQWLEKSKEQYACCETILQFNKDLFIKQLVEKQQQKLLNFASKMKELEEKQISLPKAMKGPDAITDEWIHKQIQTQIVYDKVHVHLVKPLSFMNLSGNPLRSYADKNLPFLIKHLNGKHTNHRLLVLVDDLSTYFGQMRLKYKGGHGGHNGLSSIENRINTEHYHRLKFGIAPAHLSNQGGFNISQISMTDYVLKNFDSAREMPHMNTLLDQSNFVIMEYLHKDFNTVANMANQIDVLAKK